MINHLIKLLDLFPITAKMCGLDLPERLQGKDISELLRNPQIKVRENILSANNKGASSHLSVKDHRV